MKIPALASACGLLILSLAATSCSDEQSTAPEAHAGGPTASVHVSGEHAVRCGCAIDAVGHCGNYVEVGGAFVPLGGDLGLGHMEFCGREGLRARVEGELVDGTLVATSFALVD